MNTRKTMYRLPQAVLVPAIAVSLALAGASAAQAGKIKKLQLGIVVEKGADCPRIATLNAWAHVEGPGVVPIVIRNASGNTTGVQHVPAVQGPTGNWLATYTNQFNITTDVKTRYRAEIAGGGKRSNWVVLEATCGPQVRTTTKTVGSTGKPPVKKAGSSDGPQVRTTTKTVGSSGKPPVKKAEVPATKPATGKPITKPANGQAGKPTTKPTKLCKSQKIVATRHGALTKPGGLKTARVAWMAGVKKTYGTGWMNPNHAKNWKQECKLSGMFTCTVSGYPCAD